jgi:hypothetical protein
MPVAINYNLIFKTYITFEEWKNVNEQLALFLCHWYFFAKYMESHS